MPMTCWPLADRLWRGEVTTSEIHPLEPSDRPGRGGRRGGVRPLLRQRVGGEHRRRPAAGGHRQRLLWPREVHRTLRTWSPGRLHTAVYSHGHIDHVFGVPVWAAESAEAGWPEPVVVAHEALPARFDRYILTAGYNGIINRRQFNIDSLEWPTEYRYPDRTYRDHLDLDDRRTTGRAPPRQRGDRRPHLDLDPRRPGAVLRRPVHLGLAQRRQPAEGPALSAGMGRRPAPDARPLRRPGRRARGPPARARLPGGRGRPGPSGAGRHRRAPRVTGGADPRPHERAAPGSTR